MENNDDYDIMFSQKFYFYPRIYSDKCHYDLAWYKKIFYFIRLIPIVYFYAFKKVCSAIFLGKVSTDRKYVGDFLGGIDEEEIPIVYRIISFIGFVFYYVMPLLALCLSVTSLFVSLSPILSAVMWAGVFFGALVFLALLIFCATFLALDDDVGVEEKLYACDCSLSKDIHWSIDQCKLRYLNKDDYKKFLYPGQITEVKLDDIHDRYGNYIHRLDKEK